MSGTCVPDITSEVGDIFVRRVDGDRVKINSSYSATKTECIETGGIKIFKPSHWTSYA